MPDQLLLPVAAAPPADIGPMAVRDAASAPAEAAAAAIHIAAESTVDLRTRVAKDADHRFADFGAAFVPRSVAQTLLESGEFMAFKHALMVTSTDAWTLAGIGTLTIWSIAVTTSRDTSTNALGVALEACARITRVFAFLTMLAAIAANASVRFIGPDAVGRWAAVRAYAVTVQQSAAFSYFLSGAAIGHSLHLGLKLVWFTTLAPCTAAPESLISQTCSPAMFSLPADRVAILILEPLIAQLFLPAVRLGASLLSWLVGCACLAVAYARLGVFADTFVLLAEFFVPFLLIKSDTAMWSSFTLHAQTVRDAECALSAAERTRTLERTILENEKLNVETRAAELRSMMGNVAHDLKTPIQSIAMAVELLRCVVLLLCIVQCLSRVCAMGACMCACSSHP